MEEGSKNHNLRKFCELNKEQTMMFILLGSEDNFILQYFGALLGFNIYTNYYNMNILLTIININNAKRC